MTSVQPSSPRPPVEPGVTPLPTPGPIVDTTTGLTLKTRRRRTKLTIIAVAAGLIALLIAAAVGWYYYQLSPYDADNANLTPITIRQGMTPTEIGALLVDNKLVRSGLAFEIHTRLSGTRGSLQAGGYRLSPSESTPVIVGHLVSGKVDTFEVEFFPGATLRDNSSTVPEKKVDVTTVLRRAGFSDAEINAGLAKQYKHPLLADKPVTADLEGYVYGDRYAFDSGASVEDILTRTFDEFYDDIATNDLVAKFKARGLNLHQAITLASIVQREVANADDEKQVAQVFYTRLGRDMVLGSDVTYQYVADKTGVQRAVDLDSPYNTRRYPGLPPGPIASPGIGALLAVATPANGDFVYFLSGDDDKTYFARTLQEHEANITLYCKIKCSTL